MNAPDFDVRSHLYRMTGVDLPRIDGVDAHTALKVVSEIGLDMTRWPTAGHFALYPHYMMMGSLESGALYTPISASRATRYSCGRSPLIRLQLGHSSCRFSRWSVPPRDCGMM